jgi:hypothetical protein
VTALERLVADDTAGDPMSDLKYTRKTTHTLSAELRARQLPICANTVGRLLRAQKYSLRVNRKAVAETHHPDRDRQFRYLTELRCAFLDRGQPVISVDSKKRELIGNFKNAGATWRRGSDRVWVHDFPSLAEGVALPYGILDWARNLGYVVVGTTHDTAAFAVDAIELWLSTYGWWHYPRMTELLILCDGGGSNSCRTHLWKYALYQRLALEHGIAVTVCHYPPGASHYNPVDHRLFSFISLNWRGVPLRSYEILLNRIRSTTTQSGLTVDAILDLTEYPTHVKVSKDEYSQINLHRHDTLPEWNYTIYC